MFGSIGVIVGTCLAIVAGSLMTLLTFHAEYHLDLQRLASQDSRGVLMWSAFGVSGGLLTYYFVHDAAALWVVSALVGIAFFCVLGPSMWQHRIRTFLVAGLYELCWRKNAEQQKP